MSITKALKTILIMVINILPSSIYAKPIKDESLHATSSRNLENQDQYSTNMPTRCALKSVYYTHPTKTKTMRVTAKEEVAQQAITPAPPQPIGKPANIVFRKGMPPEPAEKEIAEEAPLFTVYFSGYIKPEFFCDSRQVIGGRDNQTLLYPEPKQPDRCCRDIQAHPSCDMVAIESRVRSEIVGPDILEAKAKGYIEADFYGVSEKTLNVFRMRHCYIALNWEKTSVVLGQYWHPIYTPECAPDTISCNGGVPIDPFKRAPQIRFTTGIDPIEIAITAAEEVNFCHDGPEGPCSTYLRNAVIPDSNIRLQAHNGKHVYGFALNFKRLVPRLQSDFNIKVEESINSVATIAYAAFNWESFALRLKGTIAQNGQDAGLLGGYAVHTIQPKSDKRIYANLQSIAVWTDFNRVHHKLEPGCFIGYTKNIGASKSIIPFIKKDDEFIPLTYGFGTEIVDYVFRISPRLRWFVKPVVFGMELEYTRAAYGQINTRGHIINPEATANTRLLLAAFYYF